MFRLTWGLFLALAAGGQNWPSFRGPGASGVADGQNLPLEWNVEKSVHVRWKTAIPGLAHSSPIVWGDRVFLTTAVSSDPNTVFRHGLYGDGDPAADVSKHSWRVYALDRRSGKILWERVSHEGPPRTKRHPKATFASQTPATDGKRLAVFFGSEGLFCYDLDGKLLWKQDLGVIDAGAFNVPVFQWGTASSPIIWRDLVIVQCDMHQDSFLAAYDLRDGRQVWKKPREKALPSWGTPSVFEVGGRAELVTNGHEYMRGYDPRTGEELWRLRGDSFIANPTPILAHGLFFLVSGYRPSKPIFAIRAGARGDLSLAAGQESSDHVAWSRKRDGPYIPTPLVYGDYLFANAIQGVLSCFQARTGELVYQQRVGAGGAYSASPVAADGKLYLSSEDGEIHVVKAGPSYELLATNRMGETLMATPALSGGTMFVRGRHHLFAIASVGRP